MVGIESTNDYLNSDSGLRFIGLGFVFCHDLHLGLFTVCFVCMIRDLRLS